MDSKINKDLMKRVAKELEYDFMISDLIMDALPNMTLGQLDALRHECEVEIRGRTEPAGGNA